MKFLYSYLFVLTFVFISCAYNKLQSLPHLEKFTEGPQIFYLNLDTSDSITGAKGTVLYINPKDFDLLNDKSLRIELKELHTKEQLFLNNTPTVSEGKLLESGGAYSIRAYQGDEEVKLKAEKTIGVVFPVLTNKKMSLFQGSRAHTKSVDWKPMSQNLYLGKYKTFLIKDTTVVDIKKTLRDRVDTYMLSYVVDSLGRLSKSASKLKAAAKGYTVDSTLIFNDTLVYFQFTNIFFEMYAQSQDTLNNDIREQKIDLARRVLKDLKDFIPTNYQKENEILNKVDSARNNFAIRFYEEVQISNLGWLNVDRFLYDTNETVELTFTFDTKMNQEHVYAIYKDQNTLVRLQPDYNDLSSYKGTLPLDRSFTLLAIDFNEEGELLGVRKVITPAKSASTALSLQKINQSQMKNWLQDL